jgi:hypothetical protein
MDERPIALVKIRCHECSEVSTIDIDDIILGTTDGLRWVEFTCPVCSLPSAQQVPEYYHERIESEQIRLWAKRLSSVEFPLDLFGTDELPQA